MTGQEAESTMAILSRTMYVIYMPLLETSFMRMRVTTAILEKKDSSYLQLEKELAGVRGIEPRSSPCIQA